MRKYLAEGLGTLLLVFLGVGSAVFSMNRIGAAGVAFAFGLTLTALVYGIGPISGCQINPAVTLGFLCARQIGLREAAAYWTAQTIGGIAAAALLWGLVKWAAIQDQTGALGSNAWGDSVNGGGAFLVEAILTFVLVLVVLLVAGRAANSALAGLAIGATLLVLHLVAIPLTGTSVNPARSIGPALFAGTEALKQLWLFIVAPLIGGVIAAVLYPFLAEEAAQSTRR